MKEKLLVYDKLDTPIGTIYIVMDEKGLKKVEIIESKWYEFLNLNSNLRLDIDGCKKVKIQIEEYFKGTRKIFNIPISIEDTTFRMKVWSELNNIPYGETTSYGDIANKIGNPKASRAIGQANRANPIPIIIPCHRVKSKNGKLIGYVGDNIDIQKILLEHENRYK
ncbi:methylated-DNA--[protein]-cysteine S-methyltransferase [Clostridium chauvoei]|uniref:methylated-DNA--[protein]-cysteine S-methyltransferase n=1 Tax=Clostridium chauvoei JF4335 TaxID=1351755 RepID=S6EUF7_9CLOT|nr:methylated-DNA--[protein]-cysteine S-methyltransferase [Clostridium chauvoei]ATD56080.1 cysteine methyltransferase [Clostridium chauvoei]ATD58570.1 cysteine methyltransferase [Clostridium chauvoei]CDG02875.1 Putative Methylated-DNA--protein-cysteine methyltransferase [Clostridium chauvoei JF4335]SLK22978.1 Putative Methylated-DNA--protein-cysteine methyltransferase [Clostridium chauvoei JF4335]